MDTMRLDKGALHSTFCCGEQGMYSGQRLLISLSTDCDERLHGGRPHAVVWILQAGCQGRDSSPIMFLSDRRERL